MIFLKLLEIETRRLFHWSEERLSGRFSVYTYIGRFVCIYCKYCSNLSYTLNVNIDNCFVDFVNSALSFCVDLSFVSCLLPCILFAISSRITLQKIQSVLMQIWDVKQSTDTLKPMRSKLVSKTHLIDRLNDKLIDWMNFLSLFCTS